MRTPPVHPPHPPCADGMQLEGRAHARPFVDRCRWGRCCVAVARERGQGMTAGRTADGGTGLEAPVVADVQKRNGRESAATDWDRTATSDLEALRSVFDTNGDGKLTSADSTWSQFKVAVTEPDGTLSYHTLDALGNTEIDLIACDL